MSESTIRVAFNKRGLSGNAVVGALLLGGGVAQLFDEYVLFGLTVPTPLRLLIAVAGILLGAWLTYGVVERALSNDLAIELTPTELHLHVAPGRRLRLRYDEVLGVGGVESNPNALARYLGGADRFYVHTTQSSPLWSDRIPVGSAFVDDDVRRVRAQLAQALGNRPA